MSIIAGRSRRALLIPLTGLLLFVATTATVPRLWCGRDAGAWYARDPERQQRLARSVEAFVSQDLRREDYHTGDRQFDGEWLLMT